ncbi:MAG: hypothetical protein GY796_19280 [Chloroflexi bacterium]|nr:hypothetical protein [Chloroflexota bacterium]
MQPKYYSDWDDIVRHLAKRWGLSEDTAADQMMSVVRHSIYDPGLALIISTTGLLKMSTAPTSDLATWLNSCQEASQSWLYRYRMVEHHCILRTDNMKQSCFCTLKQIGPIFVDSQTHLEAGDAFWQMMPPDKQDEVLEILLRALSRLTRVSRELAEDELTWLWSYIDTKSY